MKEKEEDLTCSFLDNVVEILFSYFFFFFCKSFFYKFPPLETIKIQEKCSLYLIQA